jgi:predicted dehydrogenase
VSYEHYHDARWHVDILIRGTNGAANHETVLAQEGVQVDRGSLGERTVDFRVYGWFPNELPSREAEAAAEADSVSGDDDEEEEEEGLFV